MAARNPSPPPITDEERDVLYSDKIGDTVFSKRWVLQVLFNSTQQLKLDGDGIMDKNLDSDLCNLWDMSMNKDVALFLQEVDGLNIFLNIILESNSPRLTEISIGLMGNMACVEDICKDITNRQKIIDIMLLLMDHRDASILIEVTRLVHVAITNNETRTKWMEGIQHSNLLKNAMFIFENSMNEELLLNTSLLLSSLLTYNRSLVESEDEHRFCKSIEEAMKQTKDDCEKTREYLSYLFELLQKK
ncbi:protein saal1-like [Xenia sp. Carnegie-2017]|uniref:protein saal1-like n=1 Tax=Xenia sp. Carnegie-2017 TaxID=2897299 RepID=UPI001F03DCF3|nr:protein saal1-like [Xenia sp. Carnegie-2017]XP_046852336.1 protein saal1-like [Xenia sp. Carnegie-2017]